MLKPTRNISLTTFGNCEAVSPLRADLRKNRPGVGIDEMPEPVSALDWHCKVDGELSTVMSHSHSAVFSHLRPRTLVRRAASTRAFALVWTVAASSPGR